MALRLCSWAMSGELRNGCVVVVRDRATWRAWSVVPHSRVAALPGREAQRAKPRAASAWHYLTAEACPEVAALEALRRIRSDTEGAPVTGHAVDS